MAVRNIRRIKPKIWIPPTYFPIYKIIVERSDGTTDDVTQVISSLEVEDNVTESIGKFEMSIHDPSQTYANNWVGNEIFRYYKDYATSATTLRFRGRIEKPSKRGMKLNVKGRSESKKLLNITVTKSYENTECSLILKDLFTNYASDFTVTNVNSSTVNLTVNWYQKPFFECIQELCTATGFDFYVDSGLDAHFFESGSVQNTTEGIVHNHNLLEVEDFSPDLTQLRNRIIIYGATVDGIQIVYTAESNDPDYGITSSYGVKEEIVNDENITTYEQAKDYADFLLADKIDPPDVGSVKGILLATLQPGEQLRVSSPSDKLDPGFYNTTGYKDKIDIEGGSGLTTTAFLNKEPRKISHIFKDRIEAENKKKSANINPYEMKYSYNFLFDSNSGTHTNTEIAGGVLKLKAGQSSGNWVSPVRSVASDTSEAYLILVGETLNGASVEVSKDNGFNYVPINNKERVSVSDIDGTDLLVKVTFSNADTQIESLSLLYK